MCSDFGALKNTGPNSSLLKESPRPSGALSTAELLLRILNSCFLRALLLGEAEGEGWPQVLRRSNMVQHYWVLRPGLIRERALAIAAHY